MGLGSAFWESSLGETLLGVEIVLGRAEARLCCVGILLSGAESVTLSLIVSLGAPV